MTVQSWEISFECYSESNLWRHANRTSNEKNMLYMRRIKVYLNNFSTCSPPELKHFSCRENTFLYACIREFYRLWPQPRFDTFLQLLITVDGQWSHTVLQVGKVADARNEGRAASRTVKQLPVETFQQCSFRSSCYGQTLSRSYTAPDFSNLSLFVPNGHRQFVSVFRNTFLSLLFCLAVWIPLSTLHLFCSKNICHLLYGRRLFNLIDSFCESRCIHCFDCYLVSIFTN